MTSKKRWSPQNAFSNLAKNTEGEAKLTFSPQDQVSFSYGHSPIMRQNYESQASLLIPTFLYGYQKIDIG